MQRYEKYTEIIRNRGTGKRRYATMYYPRIERKTSDVYKITKLSDRLDTLANEYYGDPRWWVIIARVNKLYNGTVRVPPGIRIRIPFPLSDSELNDYFNDGQY